MDQERIWQEFTSLPPEAQQQVMEFIAFLRQRHKPGRAARRARKRPNLADEPFIGMWRDREDMQDSSAWVRRLREREWMP